jgi:hypothetical protein
LFPLLKLVHETAEAQRPEPFVSGNGRGEPVWSKFKLYARTPLLEGEHLLDAVSHHVVMVVLIGFDVKFVLSVGDGLTVRRSLTWGVTPGRVGRPSGQSYRP